MAKKWRDHKVTLGHATNIDYTTCESRKIGNTNISRKYTYMFT